MKTVMGYQTVRKDLIKILDFSWHLGKEFREEKDTFVDALEDNEFLDENNQLKICLEESKITIETLKNQLEEKEKQNEKLECEVVSLRKDSEKVKTLNLRFAKGSETLDEIIKVQHSPLVNTCLG